MEGANEWHADEVSFQIRMIARGIHLLIIPADASHRILRVRGKPLLSPLLGFHVRREIHRLRKCPHHVEHRPHPERCRSSERLPEL